MVLPIGISESPSVVKMSSSTLNSYEYHRTEEMGIRFKVDNQLFLPDWDLISSAVNLGKRVDHMLRSKQK